MDRWDRVERIIDRWEETLLIILLGLMILIAFSQIVLRNFFSTGLTWGDALVRDLVLWVGFIGAAMATREGKHINIDLMSRWVPLAGKPVIEGVTHLFSFLICGLLTFAALKFLENENQMGNVTFLEIPSWIPGIILPISFGLMALGFGFRSFRNLFLVIQTRLQDRGEET
jgi:TRAP-type C4-dicarboxylate transport system permease small subunit